MTFKVVHSLPKDKWKQFVDQSPGGNIFHTPDMFEVFSRAKGYTPEVWAVFDEQDKLQALLNPVQITLRNGLLRNLTTRSVVYGGVVTATEAEKTGCLEVLLKEYVVQTKKPLFTEIRHQAEIKHIKAILSSVNFQFEDHLNYLVDLTLPVEDVWQNIGKSTRKNIQKALRTNTFSVEEITDNKQLPIWYQIIKKTFAQVQVPLADYSLFQSAFDVLYSRGMIQFLIGKVNDQYVAASVALLYKNVIYGWYRGFDRDYGKFIPNDLMVWHLLKWGAENGYTCFDFGGAGKPDEEYGPRAFKQKFGGTLVGFGRSICIHAPIRLKISQIGYSLLRKYL